MNVKAQLFIKNNLFKVIDMPDVRPEILVPLPQAYMDMDNFTKEVSVEELRCTFTRLVFRFEGIVKKENDNIIARYQYMGGTD